MPVLIKQTVKEAASLSEIWCGHMSILSPFHKQHKMQRIWLSDLLQDQLLF